MATSERLVRDFARLGQEILMCDWQAHYRRDAERLAPSPPGLAYAQPGFVGNDYVGLVVIGQNPGVGNDAFWERRHRAWEPALKAWRDEGTADAYGRFLRIWQTGDLPYWTVWAKWVAPILTRLGLTEEHVGYLNLVKNQTAANGAPTARMYEADWAFTRRQLELLEPSVVVAGGLAVGRQIRRLWPDAPFTVLEQDRVRSQSALAIQQQAEAIAERVGDVLGPR